MNVTEQLTQIQTAAAYLRQFQKEPVDIALVLGSGLGNFGQEMNVTAEIPYGDIPHFPVSTVPGHSGKLMFGEVSGKRVVAMSGRFHFYEGYPMQTIAFPVRVLRELGVETYLLTNAAGGVNTKYRPGDLMVIADHIKFFDDSPLRGANLDSFGPRFCDMSNVYTRELRELLQKTAKEAGIEVQEGVYAFMPGPSFETPAEIRALRTLGADAVGMSTAPEAIAAAHCGMKIVGISCISNMAAGILDQPLSHDEVIETGNAVAGKFSKLVKAFLAKL